MIGRTAFLAPLIVTSPRNGIPPLINRLSIIFLLTDSHVFFGASGFSFPARGQSSRAVSIVFVNRFDNPLFLLEKLLDRFSLAISKFQHDFSARIQERSGFSR